MPITISSSETVQAIAVASGYSISNTASASYAVNLPQVAVPTFSVPAGAYSASQIVSMSDATAAATIYYTRNGATPTTSSTLYTGPITVSTSETIQAIAAATGYSASAIASATYTINLPPNFALAESVSALTITSGEADLHDDPRGFTCNLSLFSYPSGLRVCSPCNRDPGVWRIDDNLQFRGGTVGFTKDRSFPPDILSCGVGIWVSKDSTSNNISACRGYERVEFSCGLRRRRGWGNRQWWWRRRIESHSIYRDRDGDIGHASAVRQVDPDGELVNGIVFEHQGPLTGSVFATWFLNLFFLDEGGAGFPAPDPLPRLAIHSHHIIASIAHTKWRACFLGCSLICLEEYYPPFRLIHPEYIARLSPSAWITTKPEHVLPDILWVLFVPPAITLGKCGPQYSHDLRSSPNLSSKNGDATAT